MRFEDMRVGQVVGASGRLGKIVRILHDSFSIKWDGLAMSFRYGADEAHRLELAEGTRPAHERVIGADDSRFPHKCPGCGCRAYIGFRAIEHESPRYCARG